MRTDSCNVLLMLLVVMCRAWYLSEKLFLVGQLLDAVRSVDVLQFLDDLFLAVANLLDVVDGGVVHLLLDGAHDVVALVQSVDLRVELVDLVLAALHQLPDVVLVLADRLRELHDVVVAMFVERTHDAHTRVATLAVESHHLVLPVTNHTCLCAN